MTSIEIKSLWLEDDAKALARTLREPHMTKLFAIVRRLIIPTPASIYPNPGVDYISLGALSGARVEGRSEVIDWIEDFAIEAGEELKELPAPYQHLFEEITE